MHPALRGHVVRLRCCVCGTEHAVSPRRILLTVRDGQVVFLWECVASGVWEERVIHETVRAAMLTLPVIIDPEYADLITGKVTR